MPAIGFQLEVGDAHGFDTMLRVVHPFDGERAISSVRLDNMPEMTRAVQAQRAQVAYAAPVDPAHMRHRRIERRHIANSQYERQDREKDAR